MVIKKIIKHAVKKALKSKKKGGKVRLPPKPKSVKMRKAQVSLADRKRAAAMVHVRKLESQGRIAEANKARAWIQQGDAFRRGSGTKKDFNAWAKRAKTLGPSREKLQPKEIRPRGVTLRSLANREEYWRKGYTEKGKRSVWGTPPTGMAKRSIENKLHKWRQDKIARDTEDAWRSGYTPYGQGWAIKVPATGKKPVRKGPRTVAGLDRSDWFVAGLAGAGPAIGAAYWENKEAIKKLPGNAIGVIRDRRDQILRRLGLI